MLQLDFLEALYCWLLDSSFPWYQASSSLIKVRNSGIAASKKGTDNSAGLACLELSRSLMTYINTFGQRKKSQRVRRSSEFWTSNPSATRIVPVILHRKWFLEWIEHSDYKHGHLSKGFRAHTLSPIQLRARPKFLPSSARSEITWTVTLGYFGTISTKHNKTWENNLEEFATHFGVHSRSVTWGMRTQDPSSAMPLTISRKLLRWSSTWCMCIAHHSAS